MGHTTGEHYLLCLASTLLEDYQYCKALGAQWSIFSDNSFKNHFWVSFLRHKTTILSQSSYK